MRRFALVVLLVVGWAAVAGTTGAGWYYSDQLLLPANARPGYPETVLATGIHDGHPTVVLSATHDTTQKGEWGLVWAGGHARLGDVVAERDGRVERSVLDGAPPAGGTRARMETSVWEGDPHAVGLDFQQVEVPTELGAEPAWLVPATRDTWVVAVHGRGSSRTEALRVLPQLHAAGLPVLAISYRNDAGAPASPDGLYHLGATEWRDVAAAVGWATDHGAAHVLLYGWSMGGALVGQFLARSDRAGAVSGVVLDAPVVSWRETLDLQAANRGLPPGLTPVAEEVAGFRANLDFDRFDLVAHPPVVRPPTLLLHGSDDRTVPVSSSRALAAAAPGLGWPITYREFPGAAHTAEWNTDQEGYRAQLGEFLTSILGGAPSAH